VEVLLQVVVVLLLLPLLLLLLATALPEPAAPVRLSFLVDRDCRT
jgi:hypothetical protein